MQRSRSLENKELLALFGGERERGRYCVREEDWTSEEFDLDCDCGDEGQGGRGGVRSSVSLEIHGLQREQQVYFSNQEYYRRLEELKNAHLRNMAELERMYISQGREWHREEEEVEREEEEEDGELGRGRSRESRQSISSCCSAPKLQRINSQEELDFHDTSSGSDQSELCGEGSTGELELDHRRRSSGPGRTFSRDVLLSPEEVTTQKQFRFQPKTSCPKPKARPARQNEAKVRSNSKVTVPKPFQMMLREEDRKRHKVRSRSEIELENMLLRRELEELRECQKKFKASPAPAHTHLPLYDIISRRSSQRSNQRRGNQSKGGPASAAASPQPFHFLERERRKKEAKIVAELGNLCPKEERQVFKARPMPSSVYGGKHRDDSKNTIHRRPRFLSMCTLEREVTEGHSDPNSDLEPEVLQSTSDASPDLRRPQRCPSSKPVKKQIELSIEMVKEREWSYLDPLKTSTCSICSPVQPGGPEPLISHSSECISV
ncbi:hypothetical protein INR49_020355 [Caranx melampygus]|nr:hypothetical protein INR49_020355 [Caranx melampygus]